VDAIQEPIVDEALRLITKANERGLILRVMGAIAFRLHCPKFRKLFVDLKRELSDIDFMAYSRQRADILEFLREFGYTLDLRHAFVRGDRVILNNPKTKYHVDVFFDKLQQSPCANSY